MTRDVNRKLPRLPPPGDATADVTHTAKGRAVSEWERLEIWLSDLYAAMIGYWPHSPAGRSKYGEPMNFMARIDGLERVADRFFRRNCNQEAEGVFEKIVEKARDLSLTRNEITHSLVQGIAFERQFCQLDDGVREWTTFYSFYLVPSSYTDRKFDKNNKPDFMYTAADILRFVKNVASICNDVIRFTTQITLLSRPSCF